MYRVVNYNKTYNIDNDAMVVEYTPEINHSIKGVIGFDYVRFYEFLQTLVDNRLF